MRILVSNDDGIGAPSLGAMVEAVADLGEITIVAPARHSSGLSHAFTVSDEIIGLERALVNGRAATSVHGTPADCVRLALRELMNPRPDLVLAGINRGANVGVNIFYSGTVAAAAEAAFEDIPAVALSAEVGETEPDYAAVAAHCRSVLDRLLAGGPGAGELVNVNVPALGPGRPRGVRVVSQSAAKVVDTYLPRSSPAGCNGYRISPDYEFLPSAAGTDVAALADSYITVTPLRMDLTATDDLARLAAACQDHPA